LAQKSTWAQISDTSQHTKRLSSQVTHLYMGTQ